MRAQPFANRLIRVRTFPGNTIRLLNISYNRQLQTCNVMGHPRRPRRLSRGTHRGVIFPARTSPRGGAESAFIPRHMRLAAIAKRNMSKGAALPDMQAR